ncbi:hypothetical protein KR018_006188 [Drosophila ironensis]|nr:hypothetical protein KR018_006188 [Drosophila ironensis]
MSSLAPCFSVGSVVRCTTCFGDNVAGEVVAFDLASKMLMLKCPTNGGAGDEQILCNLTIVNLSLCMDIEIVKEMIRQEQVKPPEPVNLMMIQERLNFAMQNRSVFCRSFNPNATPLGQALFRELAKFFGDDKVKWNDRSNYASIQVMRQATISSPYWLDNISHSSAARPKLLQWIRQIIKYLHTYPQ